MNADQVGTDKEKASVGRLIMPGWFGELGLSLVAVLLLLLGLAICSGYALLLRSGAAREGVAAVSPEKEEPEFVYFPSQYTNQATESEEHIQAF